MAEKKTKTVPIKITDRVPIKVTERVTEKQMMILKEIIKDKFVKAKHLSVVVGISERKIKENIKKLKKMKNLFIIEPKVGILANGTQGEGRMVEIEEIFKLAKKIFAKK